MDTLTELQDFTGEDSPQDQELASLEEGFSLDSLLADSMAAVAREQKVKESRKRLAKGNLGEQERLEIEATVQRWDLERVWTPEASVAAFQVQRCANCGSLHHHFVGYFQRQSHKTSAIMRWQRTDASQIATSQLPRERKEDVSEVPLCHSCCTWA